MEDTFSAKMAGDPALPIKDTFSAKMADDPVPSPSSKGMDFFRNR